MVGLIDVLGFLLLCVGIKFGTPRLLRLLCTITAIYIGVFSLCYYLWLRPIFHSYKAHPELLHTGISAAFRFESFWKLLGNMILLQAIIPVLVIFLVYFGIKWLSASNGPGSIYY